METECTCAESIIGLHVADDDDEDNKNGRSNQMDRILLSHKLQQSIKAATVECCCAPYKRQTSIIDRINSDNRQSVVRPVSRLSFIKRVVSI
jgi:hypothetical protein